jgi:hypothetical protein
MPFVNAAGAMLVLLLLGGAAGYLTWRAAHSEWVVSAGARRPSTVASHDDLDATADLRTVLQAEHQYDIDKGPLSDQLVQLFHAADLSSFFQWEDLAGVEGNAVSGRLPLGTALMKLLDGTGCAYQIQLDHIFSVWCKTPPKANRTVRPPGLQVEASINTATLVRHVAAGDAEFTLPAWLAIARADSHPDLPAKLIYDPLEVAGHHTQAVDGPFGNLATLEVMLKHSGLRWDWSGDAIRLSSAAGDRLAH